MAPTETGCLVKHTLSEPDGGDYSFSVRHSFSAV
jgi:hypothetical protein